MMKLVARGPCGHGTDDAAVGWRGGIDVDHGDGIPAPSGGIESRHICQCLCRRLRGLARRRIKAWIGLPCRHGFLPVAWQLELSLAASDGQRKEAQPRATQVTMP